MRSLFVVLINKEEKMVGSSQISINKGSRYKSFSSDELTWSLQIFQEGGWEWDYDRVTYE